MSLSRQAKSPSFSDPSLPAARAVSGAWRRHRLPYGRLRPCQAYLFDASGRLDSEGSANQRHDHLWRRTQARWSNIRVFDSKGAEVSTGKATVDPNDLKKMSVEMKGNDSEEYVVLWNSVSADDGDPAAGSFTFDVNPNGGSSGGTTTGGGSSTNNASGVQPWLAALIGVIGLILGGVGGYYFARRQPSRPLPAQ